MKGPRSDAPTTHRLPNGVTVICDPVAGFETMALSVVAGRGARWEDERRSGWSHLLEHMVFKGAGARSARDIVEVVEAAGGQINAVTGHERTSFQVRTLAGGLGMGVAVVADLIERPWLREEDLAKEKRVVAQEIAEAADTPDDQVFELAQAAAFGDHPLGRPILGAQATLDGADKAALETWRGRVYAPDRLVVSAAGAVEEDELLGFAERAFGAATVPACPLPSPIFGRFQGNCAYERRRLEQAHLVFLLPTGGVIDPDYWTLRLFVEMLGGGMSSRLFQEARERLGLAYAIDAYAEAWADIGVLGVYAGCAASDAARLAAVAAKEIRKLAADAEAPELARAKAQLKAAIFMARESLAARAEQAAAQQLALGRLVTPEAMASEIDAISTEDLRRVGEALLTPRRATVAILGPGDARGAERAFVDALFG